VSGSDGYLFDVNSRVEQVEAHEPGAEFLMNGNEQAPLLLRSLKVGNFRAVCSELSGECTFPLFGGSRDSLGGGNRRPHRSGVTGPEPVPALNSQREPE
jgi:hypothetical protein